MGRRLDVDDLVDARGVADLLGLSQRESVSLYQRRYPLMPRPVVDLGRGRPRLWSRAAIESWMTRRGSGGEALDPLEAGPAAALMDSTERVVTTSWPSDVTMRRIAEEAGCSLGLAYHYFGSKEGLIGATLERIADRLSIRARQGRTPNERLDALWTALEANPAFHRLMTWLVLEGYDVARIMSRHPVVGDVAAEAADAGDPVLEAGMLAFCGISFQGYGVLVNRAMGRAADDDRLRHAVADMYASWVESARSRGGAGSGLNDRS